MLGVTFAKLQTSEYVIARSSSDVVRARLVALSGMEFAIERLLLAMPGEILAPSPLNRAWQCFGNDVDETTVDLKTPLDQILSPSFAEEMDGNPADGDPSPRFVFIQGKPRGYSGTLGGGTYVSQGDQYVVRATDLSGLIYINDGWRSGPEGSVSQNLARILDNLGDQLGVPGLGTKVVKARPPRGYANLCQLLQALDGDQEAFDKARPFVTAVAWVDPSVANPVPFGPSVLNEYLVKYWRGSPPLYRYAQEKDAYGNPQVRDFRWIPSVGLEDAAARVYGLDTLNPQWIELVERAPVNVNTAPREVLIALLQGLRGVYLAERRRTNPRLQDGLYCAFKTAPTFSKEGTEGDEVGFLTVTARFLGPTETGIGVSAAVVADEIVACRSRRPSPFAPQVHYSNHTLGGPFRSWEHFNAFCDHLVQIGLLAGRQPLYPRGQDGPRRELHRILLPTDGPFPNRVVRPPPSSTPEWGSCHRGGGPRRGRSSPLRRDARHLPSGLLLGGCDAGEDGFRDQ
jgi:hypothetical protein